MKKIILAGSLLASVILSAKAQTYESTTTTTTTANTSNSGESGGEYKPDGGDLTAEVGLNGGTGFFPTLGLQETAGAGTLGNLQNGSVVKFRYFLSDDLALRVGLNFTKNTTKNTLVSTNQTIPAPDPAAVTGTTKFSVGSTLLNLGIEKHFSGTDRLSTYAGLDLLIAMASIKGEGTNASNATTPAANNSFESKSGAFGYGLRLVTGADYYIVKKVYLGVEIGWGFLAIKEKDTETRTNAPGLVTESLTPGNKSVQLAPNVIGNIRLGFRY